MPHPADTKRVLVWTQGTTSDVKITPSANRKSTRKSGSRAVHNDLDPQKTGHPKTGLLTNLKQDLSGLSGFFRQLRSKSCFKMSGLSGFLTVYLRKPRKI